MNIHRDFEEFLRLLKDKRVEYVIMGGYAVGFHGYIRATNDIPNWPGQNLPQSRCWSHSSECGQDGHGQVADLTA
jgi:hypothetical protein